MAHEIGDFQHSNIAEPHRGRTKKILKKHPEIRTLIGPDSTTIWYALGLVSIQFVLAYAVKDASWWMVLTAFTELLGNSIVSGSPVCGFGS